ncbi:MAG: hypothetical protein J6A96_00620 [Clostridia bacterium]|nr:hypothetical protein [Clostridia bacterium]
MACLGRAATKGDCGRDKIAKNKPKIKPIKVSLYMSIYTKMKELFCKKATKEKYSLMHLNCINIH